MNSSSILFGVMFGFVLSRVGATDYDAISGMFRLTDLHLMGVIGTAIALSAAGFAVARKKRLHTARGELIVLKKKPMVPGLIAGSLLFGIGWALSGTCPGTALAQIGEGRFAGIATVVGIVLGAYLAQRTAQSSKQPSTSSALPVVEP
jgi:uncharacterized membrane protein YedE/YeeE